MSSSLKNSTRIIDFSCCSLSRLDLSMCLSTSSANFRFVKESFCFSSRVCSNSTSMCFKDCSIFASCSLFLATAASSLNSCSASRADWSSFSLKSVSSSCKDWRISCCSCFLASICWRLSRSSLRVSWESASKSEISLASFCTWLSLLRRRFTSRSFWLRFSARSMHSSLATPSLSLSDWISVSLHTSKACTEFSISSDNLTLSLRASCRASETACSF
mmetsp:Transcript_29121/g.52099  ORF Transcript_29121/g.52099 Transcript_29121/m.52099 type:complete len:218 (+) Transcript_29121:1360-2013(+)